MFWGSLFLGGSIALAQPPICPNDPYALLLQIISQTKNQRTIVSSTLGRVDFVSTTGNSKNKAQFVRKVSSEGQVSYEQIPAITSVSRPIRTAVERDSALTLEDRHRTEFTDENYSFQFIAQNKNIFRYKVTPVEYREGLLATGEYWIDGNECTPVRVQGSVIQSHILLRQFDMVEDLQNLKGIVLPKRLFITFRVFAFIRSISGTLDSTSQYRPEDVILKN